MTWVNKQANISLSAIIEINKDELFHEDGGDPRPLTGGGEGCSAGNWVERPPPQTTTDKCL